MQPFPHRYAASATGAPTEDVTLESSGLPTIPSASPVQFGGPGDRWSPETLLVGAAADCFVLTFRVIAGISRLPWTSVACEVSGTVDRVDRSPQFTHLDLRARLRVPAGTDEDRALRVLAKTEEACLISRSLKATTRLEASVETEVTSPG